MKNKQKANNKMTVVKSLHTNNHCKCKHIEFTNQKAQRGLGKPRPNYMLPTGDLFQVKVTYIDSKDRRKYSK